MEKRDRATYIRDVDDETFGELVRLLADFGGHDNGGIVVAVPVIHCAWGEFTPDEVRAEARRRDTSS